MWTTQFPPIPYSKIYYWALLTPSLLTKFTCDFPWPSLAENLIQLICCNCNSTYMVFDVVQESWPKVENIKIYAWCLSYNVRNQRIKPNLTGQSNLMSTGDCWINILSKVCEVHWLNSSWTCQEGWIHFHTNIDI